MKMISLFLYTPSPFSVSNARKHALHKINVYQSEINFETVAYIRSQIQ